MTAKSHHLQTERRVPLIARCRIAVCPRKTCSEIKILVPTRPRRTAFLRNGQLFDVMVTGRFGEGRVAAILHVITYWVTGGGKPMVATCNQGPAYFGRARNRRAKPFQLTPHHSRHVTFHLCEIPSPSHDVKRCRAPLFNPTECLPLFLWQFMSERKFARITLLATSVTWRD